MKFDDLCTLVSVFEQEIFGLTEIIKIEGINTRLSALVDSGNGAYNVLHGINVEDEGHRVTFETVDGIVVTKDKVDDVFIHTGSGNKETRPVVEFTIEIGSKVYPDVRFSIADRTENDHPVLLGSDFIGQVDALIDVNKDKGLM